MNDDYLPKWAGIGFVVLAAAALALSAWGATVTLTDEVILERPLRLGINLGGPNDFGAENYMSNMIPNPGFEPGVWGSVVLCRSAASPTTVVQDAYWDTAWNTSTIGQPEGFWTGASWELPLQGLSGTVTAFTHQDKRYSWVLDRAVTLGAYEPLYVRKRDQPNGNEPRPGSPGRQSRKLIAPEATYSDTGKITLDALAWQGDTTAGTLRVLKGAHELRFWAKGPAEVAFNLYRYPTGKTLATKAFAFGPEWAEYSFAFTPEDPYVAGKAPMLIASWKFKSGTSFLLDDLYLGLSPQPSPPPLSQVERGGTPPLSLEPSVFAPELEAVIDRLRPGVVRGWQGFFGDDLANLLSEPFARGPREYRANQNRATSWGYSIPELLDLCRRHDARPWLVLPPTLTLEEWEDLGEWLREHAGDFERVYVEFSNEAWGSGNKYDDPFAGATFNGGARLGAAARRAFHAMGLVGNVVTVIGGQAAWAGQNEAIRGMAGPAPLIPIAPYFGILKTESYLTPSERYYPLYARAFEDVSAIGKPFLTKHVAGGVYEINFHTTGGAGGIESVNRFVSSQAGGIALPLFMLQYAAHFGWDLQAAYELTQYSAAGVRIWGNWRDIMATGRARPTGLALELVNRAIVGDMVRVAVEGAPVIEVPKVNNLQAAVSMPAVVVFGWRQERAWGMALWNLSMDEPMPVAGLPEASAAWILASADPEANNEDAENVRIESMMWAGTIPPHSLVVVQGSLPEPPAVWKVTVPTGVRTVELTLSP